jgi:hypothetical protein
MEDHENLYDKIKEIFGVIPRNFNIMEDTIDVDLQMEYFEFSKKMSQEFDEQWVKSQLPVLHDPDGFLAVKKQVLARLASMHDVASYRAIESYMEIVEPELRDWCTLALQESRMNLESHLLEENQILISTGLGGREDKLRYFFVLIARNRETLSDIQLRIIKNEFTEVLKKYDAEIEDSNASGYLATFQLLLPIQHPVKQVFSEGIDECNQFGDFLRETCIVTNVKRLSFKEIEEFIEQKKRQ